MRMLVARAEGCGEAGWLAGNKQEAGLQVMADEATGQPNDKKFLAITGLVVPG